MARIPQENLVSARQSEVPLQPGAFNPLARATVDLLGSIDGAAQTVKNLFDKAQDIRNRSDIMEQRRIIRDSQGMFQNEIAENNTPPEEWGNLWRERLAGIEADIKAKKYPPMVMRAVGEEFKDFASRSFIQISGAALKEVRREAKANHARDYDYYMQTEQFDKARESIEDLRGSVFDDDEADDRVRATNYAQQRHDENVAMRKDPLAYKAEIDKNPDWSKKRKLDEHEQVDRVIARRAAEEMQTIETELTLDMIEDEVQLKAALDEAKHIDKDTKALVMKSYRDARPLTDEEIQGLRDGMSELAKLRTNPKKYPAAYDNLRKRIYAYGGRDGIGDFKAEISRHIPANYSAERIAQMSAKQKRELQKPSLSIANDMARTYAKGASSIDYTNRKVSEDDEKGATKNATLRAKIEQREIVIREALYEALVDEISQRGAKGETMSANDMKEFVNKNADKIIKDSLGVTFTYGEDNPDADGNDSSKQSEAAAKVMRRFMEVVKPLRSKTKYDKPPLGAGRNAPRVGDPIDLEDE